MSRIIGPDEYAASFSVSLDLWDAERPRSQQTALGMSSIGTCREQARRIIMGEPETDAPPALAAIRGTAFDTVFEEARRTTHPDQLYKAEVLLHFPEADITIPGHPDVIDPDEPSVTDWKTKDREGYVAILRNGSGQNNRFQRHGYYAAALASGLIDTEKGVVRNVYVDVSGHNPHPFVEQEPFDPDVIREMDHWLSDVTYAAGHGEQASKDPHFEWCRDYCPFFTDCRLGETQWVDEPITDPRLVKAVEDWWAADEDEKSAAGTRQAARNELEVLQPKDDRMRGYVTATGYRLRWSWVNKDPRGYWRLSVEPPKVSS